MTPFLECTGQGEALSGSLQCSLATWPVWQHGSCPKGPAEG